VAQFAISSEIYTKHINAVRAELLIVEC